MSELQGGVWGTYVARLRDAEAERDRLRTRLEQVETAATVDADQDMAEGHPFWNGEVPATLESVQAAVTKHLGPGTEKERDAAWQEGYTAHHKEHCEQLESRLEEAEKTIREGRRLVNEMDRKMPEGATEDAEGFINSYRIPTGPWHRLLGWARAGSVYALARAALTEKEGTDE